LAKWWNMSDQTLSTSAAPALLIDGSALFFGQRAVSPDRNLNYIELQAIIRRNALKTQPRPAYFFTSADEANEKQAKFHSLITDEIRWTVRAVPPHDASTTNPLLTEGNVRVFRFDTMIAYALGRLSGKEEVSRICVISDSWPLAGPVRDCVGRGTGVTMCFFGSVIDTRWHRVFREAELADADLAFLDLDQYAQTLFDRPRPSKRKEDYVLEDLP
jgi:hypothetical protein